MNNKVRVRFAPSPTGGLHLGGVRTVLFNYLFAKQHGGDFVLRVEDTDQTRFVEGAEQYIIDCLHWCRLDPDEGPHVGGEFEPYRQSERKELYKKYAEQLVQQGNAYYAFDTPEEIEAMRERLKAQGKSNLHYDHHVRDEMKNSLTLSAGETFSLLQTLPYVIRIKINPDEHIAFNDMIRGYIDFDTNSVDDKVLMKADGMPTYHLAVVVDDHLMKITHAFRGEEWLPSAPVHILLWKYLGWKDHMPEWAHLPLILKPDGNGKLSKRDGDRLGFPVFAMNWTDPKTGETVHGFKELGFLPEAFTNLLAMLGWNDGSEQEIFSLDELVEKFSIDRVHKAGAKFDFEKAKWYNHEWIKRSDASRLKSEVEKIFQSHGIAISDQAQFEKIIDLVKERCSLLTEFWQNASYFYVPPVEYDMDSLAGKWNEEKKIFFQQFAENLSSLEAWSVTSIESMFKELAVEKNIKAGELQMIFRIILVGSKTGPAVFAIAEALGGTQTSERIGAAINKF